jgi:TolA-binding protein
MAAHEYAALAAAQPPPADLDAVLFRWAECLRHTGAVPEAEALLVRVEKEFPAGAVRPRATLTRGLLLYERKAFAEAEAIFAALAESRPAEDVRAAALYYLGEAAERGGRRAAAVARFEQLRRELPRTPFAACAGLRLAEWEAGGSDPAGRGRAAALYREVAEQAAEPRVAAEALFQAGRLAYDAQVWSESAERFRQLLARYPADARAPESRLPAAWASHRAGRYVEALQLADAALALPPDAHRGEWLYLKANAERELERRPEAAATYARLLTECPGATFVPAARYERILTLFRDGAYKQVLAEAAAFEAPPADVADDLLWLRAESAAALADPDRAVECYRLLVNDHPASRFAPEALYRWSHRVQEQGAWAEASRLYLLLAERYATNTLAPRALFASGVCLSQAGQWEGARRDWTELVRRHPENELVPEAMYQRGLEEIRHNLRTEAAASLDELLRRFPQHARRVEALYWRATLWDAAGDLAEAARGLREALAGGPSRDLEREISYLLGTVLQRQGREADAAALFLPLIEGTARGKFAPERLCWLAEFQAGRGEFAAAETVARALLDGARDAVWQQSGWALLARAQRGLNRVGDAKASWSRALDLGVNGRFAPEAALRLGETLLDAGQVPEAEARLRDAAQRAAAPEFQSVRALAYTALGRAAEARGAPAEAVRFYLGVAILYEDPERVPAALDRAAVLLDGLGRAAESRDAARELVERYPRSAQAQRWQGRLTGVASTNAPAAAAGTGEKR